jgi:NADH-quinone oxidoreductase subunit M
MIVSLAALGCWLNSFVGVSALLGAFRANWWLGALATLAVIPAAWYMLRFWGMMFGPDVKAAATAASVRASGWLDGLILAPLLALIVLLGLFPAFFSRASSRPLPRRSPSQRYKHLLAREHASIAR